MTGLFAYAPGADAGVVCPPEPIVIGDTQIGVACFDCPGLITPALPPVGPWCTTPTGPCQMQGQIQPANDPRCPRPTLKGASCIAYGVLVMERDLPGGLPLGDVVVDLSQSEAWTLPVPGRPPDARDPPPAPPTDPQAHADAHQVGVAYANPAAAGLTLSTETVFSRCDVASLQDPTGVYNHAYGRGGVHDTRLDVSGLGALGLPLLSVEVLDYEEEATGWPAVTSAYATCDIVELNLLGGGNELNLCSPPNNTFGVMVAGTTATVTLNEMWGPVPNPAGQWVYGGAMVHVQVSSPAAGTIVDVYIGYVAVAVQGGPPTAPVWVFPHP